MTKKLLAVAFLAVLAVSACTRGGSNAASSPNQVYSAGPTESDVRSLLGSNDWWESTPSFGVRPLGLPTMPQSLKFSITSRFIHMGSSEFFITEYAVFNATSDATTVMTNISNNLGGNPITTPKAGDQSIYTGNKSPTKSSLFSTVAYVRVGQLIISIEWDRDAGFADLNQMGRIANKLVSKYKDVNSGKVKPSPVPQADTKLLPPPGTDLTLVGVIRLPIEAAVAGLGISSPQAIVDGFHQAGVKDFVFGDFALNADLSMEVRAFAFTFNTPEDATSWLDSFVGASNLDANGVASGYASSVGFYYAFFTGGTHLAMLFCNALSPQEAASRACEAPFASIIGGWQYSLTQV